MNEQTIEKDGQTFAKVFRADDSVENGMHFLTENEDPLQVGIFEREEGYEVLPHKHKSRDLNLPYPGEFIFVQNGKVKLEVFDEQWNTIGETTVSTGECIVIMQGGHALTMIEPTRILEVKQGPYPGRENDKTFRDPQ
ncbi:MAG: hypothetical protein QF793_01425 [Candidatus Peribacteraceae bacterium]|jgi:hypothetical protein|nr:hypothetical protein [Candidatus Peribacteraceae bacterium]